MERLRLILIAWIVPLVCWAQTEDYLDYTATEPMDTVASVQLPWPQNVQTRIDSLIHYDPLLQTSQIGLMVYDLTADSIIYKVNECQLLRPASTMKLVTAITALDQLGGTYQFHTQLGYRGKVSDGVLQGDIVCTGGMDPMLDDTDLRAMAESILREGIDSISGSIVADCSMKEALPFGEGWCWDDKNPVLSPLTLGRDTAFIANLTRTLTDMGVAIGRETTTTKGSLERLCTRTHSLDQVLLRMMKESDNFYAEAVFYQTAASSGHRPAKASDTRTITKRLIKNIGLGGNPYKIADGSGLSLYNYVSAELETMLLRYAWHRPSIYRHLYPSLPIAGVDGTLKKRMKGTAAEDNVHAKTGTLTGIISLAGYCRSTNGHELCFAVINQGVMQGSLARTFQDKLCCILCEGDYEYD